jgi:hypothetical protein
MRESPTLSVRDATREPLLQNIRADRFSFFLVCEGGNSLDKAPLGRVHDFVKEHGGHTVITKVNLGHFELLGRLVCYPERAFIATVSSITCLIVFWIQ